MKKIFVLFLLFVLTLPILARANVNFVSFMNSYGITCVYDNKNNVLLSINESVNKNVSKAQEKVSYMVTVLKLYDSIYGDINLNKVFIKYGDSSILSVKLL